MGPDRTRNRSAVGDRRRRTAYGREGPTPDVNRSRLLIGLAAVFAGMTVLLVALAAALRSPVAALVAVPMAAATYFFWYQVSGRMRDRLRTGGERSRSRERGGFGAGPREFDFGNARRGRGDGFGGARGRERRRDPASADAGISREEAYRALGLEPGASEQRVKRAYRERVKDAHPDRGGSEEEFKELTRAYERLT